MLTVSLVVAVISNGGRWAERIVTGCGPTCVYYLARTMGKNVSPDVIESLFGSNRGAITSFLELESACSALGIQVHAARFDVATLRRASPKGILHIDDYHFVVLTGYTDCGIIVQDPRDWWQVRVKTLTYSDLAARWDGRILIAD